MRRKKSRWSVSLASRWAAPSPSRAWKSARKPRRSAWKRWRRWPRPSPPTFPDRKSTRLNSSHLVISYAVFCLKKIRREGWKQKTSDAENRIADLERRLPQAQHDPPSSRDENEHLVFFLKKKAATDPPILPPKGALPS